MTGLEAEQIVLSSGLVVIHVWAEWNNYDKRMDEILQILRSEFEGKINFYSLNAGPEANWGFCLRHNVLNLPALIYYVNGRHIETTIGLRPEEQLRNDVQKMVSEA